MQSNMLSGELPTPKLDNKLFTVHLAYNKFAGLSAAKTGADGHAYHFTDLNLAYNL